MIKAVLDTSVFVAALISSKQDSAPVKVLNIWREGHFTLVMSPQLMRELVVKLRRKGVSAQNVEDLVAVIGAVALHISGAYEATFLNNIDPDDNMFLAAAYESKANYIVSLDKKHLLPLKHYHGTLIVEPALFIRLLTTIRQH